MPIKVLKNEGTELRLRIIGENHSTLQLFRSRLNDSKDVDYANYFQKHPDLDEPELYLRCVKGKKAEKVFRDLCSDPMLESPLGCFHTKRPSHRPVTAALQCRIRARESAATRCCWR